jgi:hypothetical protein
VSLTTPTHNTLLQCLVLIPKLYTKAHRVPEGTHKAQDDILNLRETVKSNISDKVLNKDLVYETLYRLRRTENMFIQKNHMNVHSSNIHDRQKVKITQYSSTDEWINKMWQLYKVEYYWVI